MVNVIVVYLLRRYKMDKAFTIFKTNNSRARISIMTEKEFNLGINIGYDKVKDTKYAWLRIFLPVITLVLDVNW